jgi:hypothetical protein
MLWMIRFSRLAGNPPLYPVTAAQIAIIFVSFEKERGFYALYYEATAVISRTRIFNISHAFPRKPHSDTSGTAQPSVPPGASF